MIIEGAGPLDSAGLMTDPLSVCHCGDEAFDCHKFARSNVCSNYHQFECGYWRVKAAHIPDEKQYLI